MWCFLVVNFITLALTYIQAEAGVEVHVRFPKWPSLCGPWLSLQFKEKKASREFGALTQSVVFTMPRVKREKLGGQCSIKGADLGVSLFCWEADTGPRKMWKLLNASEIIGTWVIVHWKSQISDVIQALLFKRALFNHPSIPQGKLHWSPQNNANLLDLIIFLECSNELFRIALKAHSKI